MLLGTFFFFVTIKQGVQMSIPRTLLDNIIKALDSRNKDSISSAVDNLTEEIQIIEFKVVAMQHKLREINQLLNVNQGLGASLLITRIKSLKHNNVLEYQYERVVSNNDRLIDSRNLLDNCVANYMSDIDSLQTALQALKVFASELNK